MFISSLCSAPLRPRILLSFLYILFMLFICWNPVKNTISFIKCIFFDNYSSQFFLLSWIPITIHFLNCVAVVNKLDFNLDFLDLSHNSAIEHFIVPEQVASLYHPTAWTVDCFCEDWVLQVKCLEKCSARSQYFISACCYILSCSLIVLYYSGWKFNSNTSKHNRGIYWPINWEVRWCA